MPDTLLIPNGYALHTRRSGLTAPWEPIFVKTTEDAVILGLRAAPAHANSRGLVHGGLLTALADNAMGLSCGHRLAVRDKISHAVLLRKEFGARKNLALPGADDFAAREKGVTDSRDEAVDRIM